MINAGRGPVITDQALFARDDIKWVLDVWDHEPHVSMSSIERAIIATPHIAGYANEAKLRGTWMIFNAWASRFGLNSVDWESVAGEKLMRPSESTLWSERVAAAYDIWRDDRQFRLALRGSVEANAQAFDWLRKNYPGRHEFSRYNWESHDIDG